MDRLFSNEFPKRKAHAIVLAEVQEQERQFRRISHVAEDKISEQDLYVENIRGKHMESV